MSTKQDGDWARYWRDPDRPLEAMHAHFVRHVFHPHSHDAYSFAVTETGAQRFTCRGAGHTSAAGMVMAFNPDDPHDGESAVELGFTYRIMHIGPDVVRAVLDDVTDGRGAMPLFDRPVVDDPVLARALRRLHPALVGGADPLVREERLTAAVEAMVRRNASRGVASAGPRELPVGAQAGAARRVRDLLMAAYDQPLTAQELADAAGAAALRSTGRSGPSTAWRPVTSSGCCDCAVPAPSSSTAVPRPKPPPKRASPTRRISTAGSCAASASHRGCSAGPVRGPETGRGGEGRRAWA